MVRAMVRETALECLRVNELAKDKAMGIIAQALKIQRGLQHPPDQIKARLQTQQDVQVVEQKRDVFKITHTVAANGTKTVPRVRYRVFTCTSSM